MIHTLISQLALDRAKTILENADFWGGPGAAKTSAETVTILRALGGDAPKDAPPAKVEKAPKVKEEPAPKADESKLVES